MTVVKKEQTEVEPLTTQEDSRREFLKKFGRYAAVTPPAMAILLSTTLDSEATYTSGGGRMTKKYQKTKVFRKVRKMIRRKKMKKLKKLSKFRKNRYSSKWRW